MLERVAEAVSQKVMEAPFAILEGHQREYVLCIARAAIEALMEPTVAMLSVDAPDMPAGGDIADIFRSMLKVVLEGK